MEHEINRLLDKQEIRQLLEDRQENNVVHLYRNLTTPGNSPRLLAWLQKEHNRSPGVLEDTFAIYGGSYNGGSVNIDETTEFVNSIASSSYGYTGPRTELQD